MTTDELQCVEACNAIERLCRAHAGGAIPPPNSEVFLTCADMCGLTSRILARGAGFGERDIALLCSKLCRSAADLIVKADPADATKELVEALIGCADACHVVALGTHSATS